MTEDDVLEGITRLIRRVSGGRIREDDPIERTWTIEQDPVGLDSLDFVELIVSIEEEYQVIAADHDLGAIVTVGDLEDAVRRWIG
ncbi:acyl carrier protein [Nocardioides sp. SYSU D00038]|uniref:acyl carrier protein n=1 Tax=Nocardioides sp. SYSU D00038 TaxID=2812554 RepID=UPI001967BEEB